MIRLTLLPTICSVVLLSACSEANPDIDTGICRSLADPYFERNANRGVEEYKNLELGTQYAIYMCSTERWEPFHSELAEVLAEGGEPAFHLLIAELDSAQDDETIEAISLILLLMERRGHYRVRESPAAVELMRTKAASISPGARRSRVVGWVDQIEAH